MLIKISWNHLTQPYTKWYSMNWYSKIFKRYPDSLHDVNIQLISMVPVKVTQIMLNDSKIVSCSVVSDSLWPHALWPTRVLCPWNSPGRNTWQSLLQRTFSTQGSNLGLPHCRQILYHLNHQGSPEWQWTISNLSNYSPNCSCYIKYCIFNKQFKTATSI